MAGVGAMRTEPPAWCFLSLWLANPVPLPRVIQNLGKLMACGIHVAVNPFVHTPMTDWVTDMQWNTKMVKLAWIHLG